MPIGAFSFIQRRICYRFKSTILMMRPHTITTQRVVLSLLPFRWRNDVSAQASAPMGSLFIVATCQRNNEAIEATEEVRFNWNFLVRAIKHQTYSFFETFQCVVKFLAHSSQYLTGKKQITMVEKWLCNIPRLGGFTRCACAFLAFELGGWHSDDLVPTWCVLQTLLGGGNSFLAGSQTTVEFPQNQ
jgi:hypothetical protein